MTTRLHLILPAAGLGSRFKEVGESRPKPLISVFELPMILWVLLNFPLMDSDKIWIISQVKDGLPGALAPFLESLPFEVKFLEIDGLTEGPASTVSLILKDLPDDEGVVVANSDQFVFEDTSRFINEVRNGKSSGQILTMTAHSAAWSYVGRDATGAINRVIEKVEISDEATVGVYGWSKSEYAKAAFEDTFRNNIRTNNEFYVAPTYNFMIENNQQVVSIPIGVHGLDVHGMGIPSDLSDFLSNPKTVAASAMIKKKLGIWSLG